MIESNYERLVDQLASAKMRPEYFAEAAREQMKMGYNPLFLALEEAQGNKIYKIEPEVAKSKTMPDYYFFNFFKLTMTNEDGREKSFRTDPKDTTNLDQAKHMLEGRSVLRDLVTKSGEPYQSWQMLLRNTVDGVEKLELRNFNRKAWGYEVDEALKKLPILGIENPEDRSKLIKGLENGELVNVSMPKAVEYKNDVGEPAVKIEVKEYLMEASPRFNFFDFTNPDTGLKVGKQEREDIRNLLSNNEALLTQPPAKAVKANTVQDIHIDQSVKPDSKSVKAVKDQNAPKAKTARKAKGVTR